MSLSNLLTYEGTATYSANIENSASGAGGGGLALTIQC